MKKKAFITGITGQDGSYLAELLIGKGYDIYGLVRKAGSEDLRRISHLKDRLNLVCGDLKDGTSLKDAIKTIMPDEIYNLAGHSFIPTSWDRPSFIGDDTALGVARLLEAIREFKVDARFYQASSSEVFGNARETPQTELTPFNPRNPYGVAKVYGHFITANFRAKYNIFACCGILFNHESPRRGLEYVTRKITDSVAKIKLGLASELRLGNLDARRDWGFAGDYVEAMWLILQQDTSDDYIIATGEAHSVREFVEEAFEYAGLDWEKYVVLDPEFARPPEPYLLVGDVSKAKQKLRWKPKVDFKGLVRLMVDADINRLKKKTN